MVVEGCIAIAAGIAARSVALTAFGADSGLELISSAVVLRRLLLRTAQEEGGPPSAGERRASLLVGLTLYALIAYILLAAAASLVFRIQAEASPPGIGLTIASLAIMAVLWRWRLSLAGRLGSPALRGDAACSLVCLYLAAVTLAGLLVNQVARIWWADPLAALALIWWIRGEAAEAVSAGR